MKIKLKRYFKVFTVKLFLKNCGIKGIEIRIKGKELTHKKERKIERKKKVYIFCSVRKRVSFFLFSTCVFSTFINKVPSQSPSQSSCDPPGESSPSSLLCFSIFFFTAAFAVH